MKTSFGSVSSNDRMTPVVGVTCPSIIFVMRLVITAPLSSLMIGSVKSDGTRVMTPFFQVLLAGLVASLSFVSDHGLVVITSLPTIVPK